MCHPAVAIAAMAISTAMQVKQQQEQGKAAKAQGAYQAALYENQRIVAERQAQDTLRQGEIEERRLGDKLSAIKGRQRSVLAAQGTTLDEGSPLDLIGDTAAQGAFDTLMLRNDFARKAYAQQLQADDLSAKADYTRYLGSQAYWGAQGQAAQTALGGVSKAASMWPK
jgi:hypothetical protein